MSAILKVRQLFTNNIVSKFAHKIFKRECTEGVLCELPFYGKKLKFRSIRDVMSLSYDHIITFVFCIFDTIKVPAH